MKKTTLALILITATAHAWDAGGHMLVGQIAWELSSPRVRAAVDEIVGTLDNRYNGGQAYNFTTVSCWMDDLRSLPKKEYPWSTWHYVDSEKTDDGKNFKVPEGPNIVWAIGENLKTLRNKQAPADERAKALGMLFHWVGDIHQPLHATTWNDRGGNGYLISGVHFSDLMPGMVPNLHTFWDKSFRFDVREGAVVELWANPKIGARPKPGEGIITEEARELMKRFPRATLTELAQPGDAEAWARESHLIGCKSAYPPGPHPDNTEAPRLAPEFAHAAYDISGRRIVIAAHRMAALLAELFPEKK
jgi:hypothetical protein